MSRSSDDTGKSRRYRVRKGGSSDAVVPMDAVIEVDRDGVAFLILDGARSIRADSLADLLTELRLQAREIELDAG